MHLHTDADILPKNPQAWASWNVRVSPELRQQCTVSYHMNTLQSLNAPAELIVSLNSGHLIDPKKFWCIDVMPIQFIISPRLMLNVAGRKLLIHSILFIAVLIGDGDFMRMV